MSLSQLTGCDQTALRAPHRTFTFSYPNLQPNQGNTAVMSLRDAALAASARSTVTFDTYYANQLHLGGGGVRRHESNAVSTPAYFIDNPLYTATNAAVNISGNPTSYYQLGQHGRH